MSVRQVAPAVQPNPPTGVNAVAGPGSGDVTISWNLSGDTDVDYYRIHEGTSPGTYTYTYDHIPAEWNTGTIISELTDGITYYYAMTTVNTSGMESNLSNETNAMPVDTGDTEPPADPTNLTITDPGTGDELGLTWTASTDDTQVSHYLIYRLTNNPAVSEYSYDSEFPKYTTATSYIDFDLWDADTYYYKVLAVDEADNWSGLSNLASDSPDDNFAPSAPPYAGIVAGDAVVDLWWSAPDTNTDGSDLDDLEGFNVYRGTISGSYDPAPINGSYPYSGLDYTDTNVINGQTYYYVIKAVDYSGNEGPASAEVSDTTDTLDDPPLAPANLSITEKDTELLLTWSPNYEDDLVGYNVYRGTTSGSYTLIAQIGIYEWYVDQNVLAGQTYYYVVTAEDEGGNESGYSNEVSGMIGEGDIWIISPTSSNPAVLNFLQYQSASVEGSVPITTQVSGPRVKITYDYNIIQLFVSETYMEISDASSGNVVYEISEWRPWSDPYFMWNGKYNVGPDQDNCVPDGQYSTRIYLKVFDYFDIFAETVEKGNIEVKACAASMIEVEFTEDTAQSYGYDNYTKPDIPWKSVKTGSSTDTAKAVITPASDANYVFFNSTSSSNITASPNQAGSSPETVTVTGIAKGESDIQANIGSTAGYNRATMKAAAYDEVIKNVAIVPVNEENDDVQVIGVGNGSANSACIDTGTDGINDSTKAGDDVQLITVNQGEPNQTAITAGPDGILDTTPLGDDAVIGNTITTGPDGICNTTVAGDDVQSIAVDKGKPNAAVIDTGSDGICNTSKAGDDNQVIPVGQGQPYQICVSAGANGACDSTIFGDDWNVGQDIDTGTDGICDSSANGADVIVAFNGSGVASFINKVFNQAVVSWDVVDILPAETINYDVDKDGKLDSAQFGRSNEENIIINSVGVPKTGYDKIIFIVKTTDTTATGYTWDYYGYVFVFETSPDPKVTITHELGHATFALPHTPTDNNNIMYDWFSLIKWRLRKNQWDICNP